MDEENKIEIKKLICIVLSVVIVAVGLTILFVILPFIEKVHMVKDDLEEEKLVFNLMKDDVTRAESYSGLLVNIKENEDLLENALIKKDEEVAFIKRIEEIARQVGGEILIEPHTVSPKKEKVSILDQSQEAIEERKQEEELKKSRVYLMINIKGNYRTFLEFMYKFENMPYVFDIKSVLVDKGGGTRGSLLNDKEDPLDHTEGHILISFLSVNQ